MNPNSKSEFFNIDDIALSSMLKNSYFVTNLFYLVSSQIETSQRGKIKNVRRNGLQLVPGEVQSAEAAQARQCFRDVGLRYQVVAEHQVCEAGQRGQAVGDRDQSVVREIQPREAGEEGEAGREGGEEVAGGGDVGDNLVTSALDLVTKAELEVLIIKIVVS